MVQDSQGSMRRVEGEGSRAKVEGSRAKGLKSLKGFGLRVWGLGVGFKGFGLKVQG